MRLTHPISLLCGILALAVILITASAPAVHADPFVPPTPTLPPVVPVEEEIPTSITKNVLPPAGRPSTTFSFFATGFDGGERVAYWFNAPDGTVYSNEYLYRTYCFQGRADWSWRSPEDAMPGTWTAVVESMRDDDEDDLTVVIPFEILPSEIAAPDNAAPVPHINFPTGQPVVAVDPPAGLSSTRFAFYATGFNHSEKVSYWFNAPNGFVYADEYTYITRSFDGRADWTWLPPDGAEPGVWTAVARGKSSHTERVIQFEIRRPTANEQGVPPPNSSEVAVEPASAPSGSRFHFSAAGFNPRETVYFWASDAAGQIYDKRKYQIRANEEGVAYWNWKTPPQSPPGVWTMVALGEDSDVQQVIHFTVDAGVAPGAP